MGYRIEYHSALHRPGQSRGRFPWALSAGFFLLFLLLVTFFWPQGKHMLQKLLWPGDWQTLTQAVEVFAQQLQWGEPFADAAGAFCREMLHFEHLY